MCRHLGEKPLLDVTGERDGVAPDRDHVVASRVLVLEVVEHVGHVAVAVVPADRVHAAGVRAVRLVHGRVPLLRLL
jgi:hypothetical protein